MTGTDWSMMQSSAGMLANSDHTHDYSIMHNIESPLEDALDKMNNSDIKIIFVFSFILPPTIFLFFPSFFPHLIIS